MSTHKLWSVSAKVYHLAYKRFKAENQDFLKEIAEDLNLPEEVIDQCLEAFFLVDTPNLIKVIFGTRAKEINQRWGIISEQVTMEVEGLLDSL